MTRRRKVKKYTKEWYTNLFLDFTQDTNSREDIKGIYKDIYDYYKEKINTDRDFIKIERLTLEKKAGIYKSFGSNFSAQLILIPFGILLTSLFQIINPGQTKTGAIISFILSCFLFAYMIHEDEKNNTAEKELIYITLV